MGSPECSLKASQEAYRPLQDDARFLHRGCLTSLSSTFFEALMEEIAAGAPGFQRGLHGRCGYGEIIKPLRSLIGF